MALALVSCHVFQPGAYLTSPTPYSECLDRVRSVLVFYSATGRANAAVLAELESEVRSTVATARMAGIHPDDVADDLDRLAATTLPASAAASASRAMRGWIANGAGRASASNSPSDGDELTGSNGSASIR